MKAAPVLLPSGLQTRLGNAAPSQFMAVGNIALLTEPLFGLIAGRQCPGIFYYKQWSWQRNGLGRNRWF